MGRWTARCRFLKMGRRSGKNVEMEYVELALMADQICSKVPPMSGFRLLSEPSARGLPIEVFDREPREPRERISFNARD